jgi:hypothetical protein
MRVGRVGGDTHHVRAMKQEGRREGDIPHGFGGNLGLVGAYSQALGKPESHRAKHKHIRRLVNPRSG